MWISLKGWKLRPAASLHSNRRQFSRAAAPFRLVMWPQIYHHAQLLCLSCLHFLPCMGWHLSFATIARTSWSIYNHLRGRMIQNEEESGAYFSTRFSFSFLLVIMLSLKILELEGTWKLSHLENSSRNFKIYIYIFFSLLW